MSVSTFEGQAATSRHPGDSLVSHTHHELRTILLAQRFAKLGAIDFRCWCPKTGVIEGDPHLGIEVAMRPRLGDCLKTTQAAPVGFTSGLMGIEKGTPERSAGMDGTLFANS